LLKSRSPWYVVLIPLLWSLIGLVAALKLGMYEDLSLFFSAIVFVIFNAIKPVNLGRTKRNFAVGHPA